MVDENKKLIKKSNILKQTVNGAYRLFVLWIIRYHKHIHGYAIMKELDKFFERLIEEGAVKNSTPSKIYPILKNMEDCELIEGNWQMHDHKKVKYYKITEKGDNFLEYLFERVVLFEKNDQWKLFIEDCLKRR